LYRIDELFLRNLKRSVRISLTTNGGQSVENGVKDNERYEALGSWKATVSELGITKEEEMMASNEVFIGANVVLHHLRTCPSNQSTLHSDQR